MGIIKRDEIRGYWIDDEPMCLECAEDHSDEAERCGQDQIITNQIIGDDLYFCYFCENKL
jgi:hypothetical protein